MQHIFKGSIQVAVVGVLLRVTAEQCCHCWFFSLDLFFLCFIWGSEVFIENLGFFDSGQIFEMYVVILYFPFKNTVVSPV